MNSVPPNTSSAVAVAALLRATLALAPGEPLR